MARRSRMTPPGSVSPRAKSGGHDEKEADLAFSRVSARRPTSVQSMDMS